MPRTSGCLIDAGTRDSEKPRSRDWGLGTRKSHSKSSKQNPTSLSSRVPSPDAHTTPQPNASTPAGDNAMSTIDFTSYLKLMAHKKASDLFVTAGVPPSMKGNGKIAPITQSALTPQQSRVPVSNVKSGTA